MSLDFGPDQLKFGWSGGLFRTLDQLSGELMAVANERNVSKHLRSVVAVSWFT